MKLLNGQLSAFFIYIMWFSRMLCEVKKMFIKKERNENEKWQMVCFDTC